MVNERFVLETVIDCAADTIGKYRPEKPAQSACVLNATAAPRKWIYT